MRHRQVDKRVGLGSGLLARAQVRIDRLAQVVDGVKVYIFQRGNFRFDVARHGEVDEEHRPAPACGNRIGDHRARQHRLARRGGTDHDVGFGQMPRQVGQA